VTADDKLRAALEEHGCAPRGSSARCPAHDDRNASLSIGPASQFAGVLLNCHAGCSFDDILTAIGLTRSDLFDEPNQAKQGSIVVAEYPYVDESGNVLYIKQRRSPKHFRQYTPTPSGGRSWSLNGVRRVLYRLPEVIAAIDAAQPIYLVEGEKDADALDEAGVVATTWTEGAWRFGTRSKWSRNYTKQLTGAHVVIVRDRDDPGRHTAKEIAAELKQHAASIKIVEAVEGKDASDHLTAGYRVDEFIEPTSVPLDGQSLDGPASVTDLPKVGPQAGGGARPRVQVTNAALAADWLREELGRGGLAGIFRRGAELVHTPRMGEEGYLPPLNLGMLDAGPAQVRMITTAGVKALVETRYSCWKTVGYGDNQRVIPALLPQQSAASACEAARLGEYAPSLRVLHGVTHTPTMRPDGSIMDTPGYDAATGFLYLPDSDLVVPPIPEEPTPEEIQAAVELILTPIAEFPFINDDDRATWIGLAFTPALRPLLPGPYQLGIITATNPGSGKTKLAKMIATLHGGVQRGEMPRDADELRKSITAALMDTTAPVITFDNLTGVIRSSVLESLLTSQQWTDRWLGQNRSVTAANDRLWLATGNNAAFGGDLERRIATVALDPPAANHHLRTDFKIKDLDSWTHEHRGELLAAILTLARGWVVAGRPSPDVRSDDFAPWINGLRGLLGWAGFSGTFGGSISTEAMSADDEEWHAFLVAIHDAFGTEPFTVKALVEQLHSSTGKIDPAVLPGDLPNQWGHIRDGKDAGFRRSLGLWLKNRIGRFTAGWSIVAAGTDSHANTARYAVKPPCNPESCGSAEAAEVFPTTAESEDSSNTTDGASTDGSQNFRYSRTSANHPRATHACDGRWEACANTNCPTFRACVEPGTTHEAEEQST
jgi:5S rRNA maturation endonuclease (ribonuclease M5)